MVGSWCLDSKYLKSCAVQVKYFHSKQLQLLT